MAVSNRERIGQALDLLNTALRPYVERELQAAHGAAWETTVADARRGGRRGSARDEPPRWDTQALLKVLWDQWQLVFGKTLGRAERSLVSELIEVRNQWAHQQALSTDDTYRALDSIERLLKAIAAPEALEAERQKQALLRVRFEEQARREHRRASGVSLEGQPAGGLKPWREIVMPHPDVASGRYQQAEFAADLSQVHRGEATLEYQEPREFFRRTYLTEGLRHSRDRGAATPERRQCATRSCSSRPTSVAARRTPCWRSTISSRASRWPSCRAWSRCLPRWRV